MLEKVEPKKVYVSPSGIRFRVDEIRRHGQDCSLAMVCYTNLDPTKDYPVGTKWTIAESMFLARFSEYDGPEKHRVAFLDFDGVFTLTYGRVAKVDSVKASAVAFLDSALTELGIKIVVSSSWRIGEDRLCLSTYLDLAGFTARLHDDFKTKSTDGFRGNDVREWLSRHPEVTEWVIIDDETDFHEDQLDRLVHVDMAEGFGARDYVRLKSVFWGSKRSESFTTFQDSRCIGRDLPTYYDQYLLENGEACSLIFCLLWFEIKSQRISDLYV